MKNILILSWFTLKEALERKVFIFFMIISAIVILGLVIIASLISTDSLVQGVSVTTQKNFVMNVATTLQFIIISPLSSLCLLLAIFSSASFVPNMLEKGNIDLLLSKPVSRSQLLWGKYFGGILVVLINIAFLIVGVWLIISLKFSYWNFNILTVIIIITFTFAVLYAMIVFFGVLTQSSILGMMVAYLIFLVLSPLLHFFKNNMDSFIHSSFVKGIISFLYYVVPKTTELLGDLTKSLASGKGINDYQPVWTSALFLLLMMYLSTLAFRKKDF